MSILITGCDGQLGWELCRQGSGAGLDIVSLDIPDIDITSQASIDKAFSGNQIDLVINAAAYTAVDLAESEPEQAFAVNRDGAAHLASACYSSGVPLIHVSTDYVFNGAKRNPYKETDPVSPLGVYGQSKAEGEDEIRKRIKEHVIVRTSWLYGIHGNNFVKTMLRLGKEMEQVSVVIDQYGCPTFAADLAQACLTIAEICLDNPSPTIWGTYHYCGCGETTWWEFASKIFELSKQYEECCVERVIPIPTSEYPTPAERPKNSVMDCASLTEKFGIEPPAWETSLANMLKRLFTEEMSTR